MRTTSDDLFRLIRSMTQGEKRYFSIVASPYSSAVKTNRYLLLFRAIDKQSEYDEAALKRKFATDSFLGVHFKKAKSTLYRMILQALQHVDSDEQSEVNDLIHRARILFRRGMHKESKKQLVLAKKLSEEKEYFTALIDACEQERSIVAVNRGYHEQWAKQIPSTINKSIAQLHNLQGIREVEAEIFGFFTKPDSARPISRERQLQKLNQRIFELAPVPRSRKATAILYNSMGVYHQQLGNLTEARNNFRKVLKLFDNPVNESQAISYAMIQSNIINASIGMKKYDEALRDLRTVQRVCSVYADNRRMLQVQCNLFHAVMSMYITSGQFTEGIEFSETIRKKYFANAILRDKVLFAFNGAALYFGSGKFRKTLSLTNEVLTIPDVENPVPKLIYWSRMLQLLSLWEMGDYDLMGHRIKSFQNFVQNNDQINEQELAVFEFIRLAFRDNAALFYEGKSHKLLVALQNQLKVSGRYRRHESLTKYFDFQSWLESKISGRSFRDIVQKNS